MSNGQPARAAMPCTKRGTARLLAALLVTAASLLPAAIASPAAQAAGPPWLCSAGGPGLRTPVLLVHGFNSGPGTWAPSTQRYFASNRARTCIDVFDYADASTQWVTDHRIAPQLATAINSLAAQSKAAGGPGKVIVVAHSMGGLATRCASAVSCSGVAGAGARIAALITFGTPTLGSFLKGSGASDVEHLVSDKASADCYETGNGFGKLAGFCSLIRALGTSAAGAAFTPGSAQQKALNKVTMPFPVLALAGSVKVEASFFGHSVHRIGDAGDLVVSEDSALAAGHQVGGLGGRVVIDCGSEDLSVVVSDRRCWHGSEPNNPDFDADALEEITKVENSLAGTTGPFAAYAGTWYSPQAGVTLVVLPSGTAVLSWLGNAVWIKLAAATGHLTGTITSVYPDSSSTGFRVGGPLTLSMAPGGGVLLNPNTAADSTRLFKQAQQPLSAYAHQWYVHGAGLTINGSTGTMAWNNGPCGQTMCTGHAAISFTPGPVGIDGTVIRTWYSQGNGQPPPPGYHAPASINAGDQFVLVYVNQQVAIEIWVGAAGSLNASYGNPYWCRMNYINGSVCGA